MSTVKEIKKNKSEIYRKVEIKRRVATTGLFETSWQDISNDVKKWGTLKTEIDAVRLNQFKFGNLKMTFANDTGRFNEQNDPASLWFGYLPIQRTLVRVKTGFVNNTLSSDGIWIKELFPVDSLWDDSDTLWDNAASQWDADATAFKGVVSGDLITSDKSEISFNIRPTIQLFRDYEAKNLNAYDISGMKAYEFMEMVRDHADVNGNYIFRPFFDDTTASWLINTTTAIYPDLNTSTASEVINNNVWQIMEKLAEAENFVVYINKTGKFVFKNKDDITATTYEFFGRNSANTEYGHTIKNIGAYGLKISKFYSRVQIKHTDADTNTSYEINEATLTVSPNSAAWLYGERTLNIENFWMDETLAQSLSVSIFDDVSAIKNEIRFSSSFIPQLDILDQAEITYSSGNYVFQSQWDLNDWGDSSAVALSTDLIWNAADGDSISLQNDAFKLISIEVDLDKLESRFTAREV